MHPTPPCHPTKLWLLFSLAVPMAWAQVSVTTYHNDIGRTGQNLQETILSPSNVNSSNFGKLFAVPVDGQVQAQPLYLQNLTIGGKQFNVVFAATEFDSVYAIDADNGGLPLWQVTLTDAAHGAAAGATAVPTLSNCNIGGPYYGITGTPVIDSSSGTLYIVSMTQENGYPVQRLHALDVTTGAEKFGGPATIAATVTGNGSGSVGGTLTFDPQWQLQRPGLLLLNGAVYIAWGAFCDLGPFHGWVMAYDATTLQQLAALAATPNGSGAGIWMSGGGLAADTNGPNGAGRLFLATGNGDYTATVPYGTNNMDYGDSILNLDLSHGLQVADDFTPYNQAQLSSQDSDLGGGGTLLLPDQPGPHPHLLVNLGKGQAAYDTLLGGVIFVLDRDNLGGFNASTDNVVQRLAVTNGERGMPAYWNGNIYFWPGAGERLWQYSLTNGALSSSPVAVGSEVPPDAEHTANPVISANGNSNGIVWSIDTSTTHPLLRAHDATNVATSLYSSADNASRDTIPGLSVGFSSPTVANGKVYIGANRWVSAYGLLAAGYTLSAAPASVSVTQGGSATATINVVPSGGFNSAVTFSAAGLPTGVTASFNPASATGSTTLTLSAGAAAKLGTATVTVTGVSGSSTQTATLTLTVTAASDFTMTAAPPNLSVAPGASGKVTVTVVPSSGFTGAVSFSASGLPAGVTASFNPANSSSSTTLTLNVATSAAAGVTLITISGASGGLTHTVAVSLTLTPAPDFTIAASPPSLSVVPGASAASTIAVTRANGFTGSVTFSASGLPSGVTASFSPASSTSATMLTLSVAAAVAPATATVTVAGSSGSLAHTTTVSLTITAAPNFGLTASPSSLSIAQGATGSATISVVPANGFTGAVTFSASGLPNGVTASFSPASSASATTLTLAVSSTASTGNATITVNGVSGQLTHSAVIGVTINGAPPPVNGGVTVVPLVSANGWRSLEEEIRLSNTQPLSALSITITVGNARGLSFNGQNNTVGGKIRQSHSGSSSRLTFTFTLANGQMLSPGSNDLFNAFMREWRYHSTSGDSYKVTYTTGGESYSQSGSFASH